MEIMNRSSSRTLRDLELIEMALSHGDQKAYAELMQYYWNPVYKMLLKKTTDENTADDLTIETFGKAFQNLHTYTPEYAFITWINKIATNNFIDHTRRIKRHTRSIDNRFEDSDGHVYCPPGIACEQPDPEENFIRKQKAKLMHEIVDRLKPHYRELIELRYFKEYSYQEISSELNLPLGTIKAQLFRARELLFSILRHSRETL
jgi:RNA polymerase sigma factor (sigma-70 family)